MNRARTRRRERADDPRRPSRYEFSKVSVGFESGGTRCDGWLYRPDRPDDPPVVVMGPGLGMERTFGFPAYAERLAEHGYASFLFDYRGFGASEGTPRNLVSPARHVADWRAAVDRVRRLHGVDGRRPVLWGTSLAGGHVLRIAADDSRIAGVVATTPLVDGRAVVRARSLTALPRVVGAGLRDRLTAPLIGPHTVPIAGDDDTAVLTGPGAAAAYADLDPAGSGWDNACPARVFLSLLRYRPMTSADEVRCPTLLVAGTDDALVPIDPVRKAAESLPDATLIELPIDHFDVFRGAFEQVLGHQLVFLDTIFDR